MDGGKIKKKKILFHILYDLVGRATKMVNGKKVGGVLNNYRRAVEDEEQVVLGFKKRLVASTLPIGERDKGHS